MQTLTLDQEAASIIRVWFNADMTTDEKTKAVSDLDRRYGIHAVNRALGAIRQHVNNALDDFND